MRVMTEIMREGGDVREDNEEGWENILGKAVQRADRNRMGREEQRRG